MQSTRMADGAGDSAPGGQSSVMPTILPLQTTPALS